MGFNGWEGKRGTVAGQAEVDDGEEGLGEADREHVVERHRDGGEAR